ncbi:hypothetical protein JW898_04940 [Candidatus Woesearchaeota archaeon]|nr:hypothetical protein [Candidatus Woesearchaeota archaeon]
MSSLDTDIDVIFAELECYALSGKWDEEVNKRLWSVCRLKELQASGQATNYAHSRLSHLMALYSAIADSPQSKRMEDFAVKIGSEYLHDYPSSAPFFLPALLERINKKCRGDSR